MEKLFDAHAHFVSSDFDRYPLLSAGGAGGHNPLHPNPVGGNLRERVQAHPMTIESVLHEWDAQDVAAGAAVQYRTAYGTDNSYLLDSCERYPGRVMPVVVIEATEQGAPDLLRELVGTRGVAGMRLTGFEADDGSFNWLNSAAALETWKVAEDLGLAVVLMYLPPRPSPPALGIIGDLAAQFPGANVVLDHIGWPTADGPPEYGLVPALRELAEHRNIYLKLTTSNLDAQEKAGIPAADFVRHAVDVYGADRLVWGSDFGNAPGTYPELVSRAFAATRSLTPTEREQVLGVTGRALFQRGGNAFRGVRGYATSV
jgi:L-fuconolactonase